MAKVPPPDDNQDQQDQPPSKFGGMSADANQPQGDAEDSAPGGDQGADEATEDAGGSSDQGTAPSGDQGGGAMQGQKATPAQQQQYSHFVAMGYHVIYEGGKPNPAIVKMLSAGDPKRSLATTAVEIVLKLVTSAKEQNVQLDGAVILKGGQALYEELADLSGKLKIHQFTQDELDAGWVLAMHLAQQKFQAAGLIDPAAFAKDVQTMNQAQQDGTIDDILPGIGKLSQEVQAGIQKGGSQGQQQGDASAAGAADDASQGAGSDMQGAGQADMSGDGEPSDAEQKFKGFGG